MNQPAPAYPGPFSAILLTLMAWMSMVLLGGLVLPAGGPSLAMGFGMALGLGGIGTLAARRVAPPQPERTGLRGFDRRFGIVLLLMLPLPLVISEIHNCVIELWPPPPPSEAAETAQEALENPYALLEMLVVVAGIAPVVEEWFFRGVLLQGLLAHVGAFGAVLLSSLLFAFGHGDPSSAAAWAAGVAPRVALGVFLAILRLRTGSILPGVLLSSAGAAAGVLGVHFAETLPIPGFNAPGDHTPAMWMWPSVLSVGAGLWFARRFEPPPLPPPPPDREDRDAGEG